MDYEALRAGMTAAIPFNNTIGFEVTDLGAGSATVRLAANASIGYTKLATGPIDASAQLPDADRLLATLDADGKVSFPVEVTLSNGDDETVATATVQWHVGKRS